jgi:S1-C subfamily serine protease
VVLLRAERTLFGQEITVAGTGLMYDLTGMILTAAHVVDGASAIEAYVPGQDHAVPARLEGIAPCQDLAMVRIAEGGPFPLATFGSSVNVQPGDDVRVAGFPGDADSLDNLSASRGTIDRVGAQGVAITGLTYTDLICTDTAVKAGYSGGPLVAVGGGGRR